MLCASALTALALGLGLTVASPSTLLRRTEIDICPQVGNNVAVPDHHTFQFPLENFAQNMCWPFLVGQTTSSICFDFVQYTLTFTYSAIPGFTYTEADIWLGFSAPVGQVSPQYTTANGICTISVGGSTVTCTIPYEDLVGGATNLDWLNGMCPNGDSQGLFFFLQTNAQLTGPNGIATGAGAQSCTDYPTCRSLVPYWELTYRCSLCQNSEQSSIFSISPTTFTTKSSTVFSTTQISTKTSTTKTSTTEISTISSPTQTPCGPNVCFSTHFNSQVPPSGDVVWLSAAFKPKFAGTSALVSFTGSVVTINGASFSAPDSFIQLNSNLQTCGTAQFVSGQWQATALLPGSGNTFLSAVSVTVPSGVNWGNAQVQWCGTVTAPGEIDVQIAAAVYTSCSNSMANPEACETHTNYHAGVPTGCLNNLIAGGTGGGGSNFSGSLSATFPVCKA